MASSPRATSEAVSRSMRSNRRRDTGPELALRRELHRRGVRYFVDRRPEPTIRCRADIVFPRARIAVFVDGCFWHSCPEHASLPNSNRSWWLAKLERNRERDRLNSEQLQSYGWLVLRYWEHEPVQQSADAIQEALRARRTAPRGPDKG